MSARSPEGLQPAAEFRTTLQEWLKDHRMFSATLAELGGQLSILQPPDAKPPVRGSAPSSEPDALMERLLAAAPSEQLRAYAAGTGPPPALQASLPQQLDDNLRLLSVLAAEMAGLLRCLEQLADSAAAAAVGAGAGDASSGGGGNAGDEALLLAAVVDAAAKETQLIEAAAAGVTLTTPPDEVSAAAQVVALQPFMDATLLEAAQEALAGAAGAGEAAAQQAASTPGK